MNKTLFRCIATAILAIGGSTAGFCNQSVIVDCKQGGQPVVTSGLTSTTKVLQSFPSCTIQVNIHGAGLATLFSDSIGTPLANPFTAQNNPYTGAGFFYAANGHVDVTISGGGLASPITFSDIILNDPGSTLGCSQMPIFTGDVTSAGNSCTLTLPNIATPGTGIKTTINAKGQATGVTTAASTDLSDTAIIARLNAPANFGANAISGGALSVTTGVFSGSISGTGATFTSEVAPSVTGGQLGDVAHRWDLFARNIDFTGSLAISNLNLVTLTTSKVDGFFYVDGITYTTVQAAITAACGAGGGTVFVPPGTYPQNTSFILCSNLNLLGAGKGQTDGAGCVTTITTTLGAGDLFPWNNMVDSHTADFCIKNIGAAGANAAIKLNYGQRNVFERHYISGPFAVGISLNTSSTSLGSTIWNTFRDIHITGLASGGIGCLLDSSDATSKVINNNLFLQVSCQGGTAGNGVGMKVTNNGIVVNQVINENFVYGGEFATNTGAGGGTGILLTVNATRGITFVEPNVENNVTGFSKANANTVLFLGGNFSSNTSNVSDSQPSFTSFLNTNVNPTIQQFSVAPDGGIDINCIGLNASCTTNQINGPTGYGFAVSSTQKWDVNTGSLSPHTAAGSDLGTTLLPIANIFVGGAATNNNKITSAVTTGARIFTLPDANSNPVIPDSGAANNFLTAISALGVISKAQPSFSNLSGSIALAQTPLTTNGDLFTVTGGVLARLATGTANQVLHGTNLWGNVVSADLNITTTTCTNQFLTGIGATVSGTCTTATLASAQFANQGTTTTVLHGNAAGNPSFGAVSLANDVTGQLPITGVGSAGLSGTAPITISAAGAIGCASCSTLSNAAGSNVIPKSNGTNFIASSLSDDGTTVSTAEVAKFSGIGINGATPSANVINGPVGWQIQGSGGAGLTMNSANTEINRLALHDLGSLYTETTAPTNVASSGTLWEDSTSHEWQSATAGSSNVGLMARVQPGSIHQTAKTAAITTATLCASSAGACNVAGLYNINWSFWEDGTACGTPGTGGVTFLLTWTDFNGSVHSAVSLGMDDASAINAVSQTFHFQTSNAAAWASGNFNIATNGAIIQYATGYTACGVGTGSYGLDIGVTRLR